MLPRFSLNFSARRWVLLSLGFGLPLWGASPPVLPEAYPAERYEKLIENSPFAVGTPQEPSVPADAPGFATNLYVMGVAQLRDAEGKERDFVTIKSRADQTTFSLSTGAAPNGEGIELGAVEWSQRVGKSKVTIRKGTETAVLEFDQASLQSAPLSGGPEGAPQIARPGFQPTGQRTPEALLDMMKRNQPQSPRPGVPFQPPGVRSASPQFPGAPQPSPQPGEPRRRVRVITSKP
jgi:hypothetical protein